MMCCKKAAELASKMEVERLGLLEMLQLKMHMLRCGLCVEYKRQMDILENALTKYRSLLDSGDALPDVSLPEAKRAQMRDSLAQELRQLEG